MPLANEPENSEDSNRSRGVTYFTITVEADSGRSVVERISSTPPTRRRRRQVYSRNGRPVILGIPSKLWWYLVPSLRRIRPPKA